MPFSRITDGDITSENYSHGSSYSGEQCFVIDLGAEYDLEEVAVWHYFGDSRVYYDNVTYTSSDNETWMQIMESEEPETSIGKRINAYKELIDTYSYTASEESVTLSKSGCYQFELWGAQGGPIDDSSWYGGKGGYTAGTKMLDAGTQLFINVGGHGYATTSSQTNYTISGGYNGGGKGQVYYTTGTWVAGGGGGGSSYIGGMNLDGTSYMYCYKCSESTDLDKLTYATTNNSVYAISEYAKNGDGEAKIYYLGTTCS